MRFIHEFMDSRGKTDGITEECIIYASSSSFAAAAAFGFELLPMSPRYFLVELKGHSKKQQRGTFYELYSYCKFLPLPGGAF